MKLGVVRLGLYTLVALALAAALRYTPRLPEPEAKAADVLVTQAATPAWKLHFDTLASGETLGSLLQRGGLTNDAARAALQAAPSLDARHVPAGMPVTIRTAASDSVPSEVTLQLSADRLLHLQRTGDTWTGSEEAIPWKTDTIVVSGTIQSNLYDAMNSSAKDSLPANARMQLAWSLADVYDYRVDMSRDLQVGDQFRVAAERSVAPSGAVRIGKVIAATFQLSGSLVDAIRYASESATGQYFDQYGKSMRAAFLHAPLEFRRISSVFGEREHPILGIMRMHKGIDYAAATGTPVRAVGDGIVLRAGWNNGGYGNLVEIRHPNGFVTRYGHLSRFAAGIHAGSHVTIGQVIAYVGSTGLATGPHLHFEVLVNGEQRDPRTAFKANTGEPLPASDLAAFQDLRDRLLASIDSTSPGVAKLAFRSPE